MVHPQKLEELRRNFDALMLVLPSLLLTHRGKYALLRHGSIVDYFDSPRDALKAGRGKYKDDLFSVQEITNAKADFGWYSRVQNNQAV